MSRYGTWPLNSKTNNLRSKLPIRAKKSRTFWYLHLLSIRHLLNIGLSMSMLQSIKNLLLLRNNHCTPNQKPLTNSTSSSISTSQIVFNWIIAQVKIWCLVRALSHRASILINKMTWSVRRLDSKYLSYTRIWIIIRVIRTPLTTKMNLPSKKLVEAKFNLVVNKKSLLDMLSSNTRRTKKTLSSLSQGLDNSINYKLSRHRLIINLRIARYFKN